MTPQIKSQKIQSNPLIKDTLQTASDIKLRCFAASARQVKTLIPLPRRWYTVQASLRQKFCAYSRLSTPACLDWGDEDCQAILATCRRSMRDNALLVVVDLVIDQGESDQPNSTGAMMDLYMLCLFGIAGGKERNEVEFRTLIENSGFIVKQVKRLPSGNGIIFAYPK
ncbi:methyltransferase [Pseudomonas sp. C32]|uniref:methyltransferase n=1 Tax=Pseudomonas sp. C32 TaxID=1529208 RepID=UPI0026263945|nr:methyltransferase [Pseudomonas sp. C32]MDN4546281.1 methyltransferase [Pseudomonas sp. C32]